jgi:hypothetical protein
MMSRKGKEGRGYERKEEEKGRKRKGDGGMEGRNEVANWDGKKRGNQGREKEGRKEGKKTRKIKKEEERGRRKRRKWTNDCHVKSQLRERVQTKFKRKDEWAENMATCFLKKWGREEDYCTVNWMKE